MRNRRQRLLEAYQAAHPDQTLSDYTYDQVFEAAALFTLSPSSIGSVDVRTVTQRQKDDLEAFEARIARQEAAQ